MTRVLVSDTSILIDLERGNLLEAAFGLECDFSVPDLLYKDELADYNGDDLLGLGLRVEELDGDGVTRALGYREQQSLLSLPDAFALSLAKMNGYVLLTGDGALRQLAEDEDVDCHGVLWVLERMNHEGAAPIQALHDGLQTIAAHPRCRLPKRAVNEILKRFADAVAANET